MIMDLNKLSLEKFKQKPDYYNEKKNDSRMNKDEEPDDEIFRPRLNPLCNRESVVSISAEDDNVELVHDDDEEIYSEAIYGHILKELKEDDDQTSYIHNINVSKYTRDAKNSPESKSKLAITPKLQNIVDELIITEENYVNRLKKILEDYIPYLLNKFGDEKYIYITSYISLILDKIYDKQKLFLRDLKKSHYDIETIVETFHKHEELFMLYPFYFKRHRYTQTFLVDIKEIAMRKQEELGDTLDLPAYLYRPIDRLGKYPLLFNEMNKEIIKSNGSRLDDNAQESIGHKGINSICGLIERIMSQGNSEVARASIEKLPIDIIDDFDTYLFKDDFQKAKVPEAFTYVDSVLIKNVEKVVDTSKNIIEICDFNHVKKKKKFFLEAEMPEVFNRWAEQICTLSMQY